MSKILELTDRGQIKDCDNVLWAITVFSEDNENDPILLFNFDKVYNYPTKEIVKKLMAEQYVDWVNWVDEGGYIAETVYVG